MIYLQCPKCGHLQRSQAIKTVKCHRCSKTYEVSKAKQVRKEVVNDGFFKFKTSNEV